MTDEQISLLSEYAAAFMNPPEIGSVFGRAGAGGSGQGAGGCQRLGLGADALTLAERWARGVFNVKMASSPYGVSAKSY